MFSEYASRYLSKSQRAVPLFNGQSTADSDVDDYIEDMSGSSGTNSSGSESSSLHSESESDSPGDPPSDLLVERPRRAHRKRAPKHKTGFSLWNKRPTQPPESSNPAINPSLGPIAGPTAGPSAGSSAKPNTAGPGAAAPRSTRPSETATQAPSLRGDLENGLKRGGKPLDNTVAAVYVIAAAASLTTAFLVSFSAPPNGGSVYPIFAYSARTLVGYAVLATAVSAAWLYCVRHFARAVVQVSVFAVPTVLIGTSVTSIAMSVHQSVGWHGLAHAALRVSALAPLGVALLWILYLRRVKDVMGKASDIVVLAAEVYDECTPMMTVLTMVSGIASLMVTGLWSFFLARAFLEGRLGLLLGAWFTFMYLWTWGLLCALLRAVLASVTMEWYMENSMTDVLGNSVYEAMSYHFSSACFSALIALLVRVPLLVLPASLGAVVQRFASVVFRASTARVLNPLALPTAVINRCSLNSAAEAINSAEFLAVDRRAYRLAKLFLVSARVCCSLVIGFVAWIHADRVQDVSSAYGYLVAIVALFIGWTVMGASENMLSMISDALLVNYVINDTSPRQQTVARLFQNTSDEPLANNGAASFLESDSDSA